MSWNLWSPVVKPQSIRAAQGPETTRPWATGGNTIFRYWLKPRPMRSYDLGVIHEQAFATLDAGVPNGQQPLGRQHQAGGQVGQAARPPPAPLPEHGPSSRPPPGPGRRSLDPACRSPWSSKCRGGSVSGKTPSHPSGPADRHRSADAPVVPGHPTRARPAIALLNSAQGAQKLLGRTDSTACRLPINDPHFPLR
jgi:hypothetical protein